MLRAHIEVLTVGIGERSIFSPDRLDAAAFYIESIFTGCGLRVELQRYPCTGFDAVNVVACSDAAGAARRYLIGAHYDCVPGTVGADDNASAVAVQLEVARLLHAMRRTREIPVHVKFVSFALEEYPAYGTRHMGSRVHAKAMKKVGEKTDGMLGGFLL